jgi:lipoprotein signal peptidase
MIVYGLSRSGFSLENSLLDIGISQQALGIIIPLIIVAGIIFLIIKLKKNSLLAIGGLFILASFFVYAKLLMIVIGIILIIIRGFFELKKKDGKNYMHTGARI